MSLKAVIFDLDGVITDTAKVHCHAWKVMFDEFLTQYYTEQQQEFKEFTQQDYLSFVDGIPRHDGIRSFLKSRSILIPDGEESDGEQDITVCGLAKKKNKDFRQILEDEGVDLFQSTISLINQLKADDIKIAVVSSSRNCQTVLERAEITHLFDTKVDGTDLQKHDLPGKPDPAMFLEAAKQLSVKPEDAAAIEDAISGVQAASAGKFGFVIGIDRHGNMHKELLEGGADKVVNDLAEISKQELESSINNNDQIESAIENFDVIAKLIGNKQPVIFLDYDGTLTPIVATPDLAVLADEMRNTLEQLGHKYMTAIVSGRQLDNVKQMVKLDDIYYAGNHGFEIEGPDGASIKDEMGTEFLNDVESYYQEISTRVNDIEGVLIEHKKFSLSVHYRMVDEQHVEGIEQAVDELLSKHPKLRKHHGKKVFEIRPAIEWHKGKAVLHLLDVLQLKRDDVLPIYIGDDVTDEDAFKALSGIGLGILVSEEAQETSADYTLNNTNEVQQFLHLLLNLEPKSS